MTRTEIAKMRIWADDKIAAGQEPPWAWYQYMKLRETLDAILAGMDATVVVDLPPHLSVAVDNTKPLEITLPM
jgi:hypothetical protein